MGSWLALEMWEDVTQGDKGPGGKERAKLVTHLEAIVPLLAQVTLAALFALGESQGELWWHREGQNPQESRVGGEIPSYGWLQNFWSKNPPTPILLVPENSLHPHCWGRRQQEG